MLDGDWQGPHVEKDAAVVEAMRIPGLPEAVIASLRYFISNGDLNTAREIVDHELQRCRDLLEDVTKFEQTCEDD